GDEGRRRGNGLENGDGESEEGLVLPRQVPRRSASCPSPGRASRAGFVGITLSLRTTRSWHSVPMESSHACSSLPGLHRGREARRLSTIRRPASDSIRTTRRCLALPRELDCPWSVATLAGKQTLTGESQNV